MSFKRLETEGWGPCGAVPASGRCWVVVGRCPGRRVAGSEPRWHAPSGPEMHPPTLGYSPRGFEQQAPTSNSGRPAQREPLPETTAGEGWPPPTPELPDCGQQTCHPGGTPRRGLGLSGFLGVRRPRPRTGAAESVDLGSAGSTRAPLSGRCVRLYPSSGQTPKQRDPIVSV